MYDYAIKVLTAESNKLESEMKDSLKMGDWFKKFEPTKEVSEKQETMIHEVVLNYQQKICDLQDAVETLKSIGDGEAIPDNKEGEDGDKG